MPDLLLELLSEEIPARMQGRAAADLSRLVTDALVAQGFLYEGAKAYATPRRLALHVVGLPAKGQDVREERRGPRVGAPEAALAGFLRSVGLASADALQVVADGKKGEVYVAAIERPGRPTAEVLAEVLPAIIRDFPWPRSMRWGAGSAEPGSLRWVRPLQSILCCFGPAEGEAAEVVPFAVDGIAAGDETRGHRFLAPGPIRVRRFDAYAAALERAKVVLDPERRREIIRHDARDLAFAQGFEVVEDEALLDEVAGLVEWPVVLMGTFEESYLDVPPEAIRATIRQNQKCFVLRGPDGALANRFILVANIEATDGGAAIVKGNERVVRARLADAKFFWDTDRKVPLADRLEKLRSIIFHEKLGTQYERVERIAALARELAPAVGADPDLAERAARLCKADLVTEMVGEFPELQGLMGRYYAAAQGEPPAVAAAIEDHYRPVGPSDRVPSEPVSIAVALADKLDTLVGFRAIGETPTGSKDPYALRRAALGVIRLVLENGVRESLRLAQPNARLQIRRTQARRAEEILAEIYQLEEKENSLQSPGNDDVNVEACLIIQAEIVKLRIAHQNIHLVIDDYATGAAWPLIKDIESFIHERLKVYLRDRGARHDLIDAVLAAGSSPPPHAEVAGAAGPRSTQEGASFEAGLRPAPQDEEGGGRVARSAGNDDLLLVVRRVEALGRLLATEDGKNLLAATKRAANILRIEEKKDGRSYDAAPDPAAFAQPEEGALAAALAQAEAAAGAAMSREDDEGAMRALATLRPAVDAFFEAVTVNAPEPALRENRLRLLSGLRRATNAVADFNRIEG